MTPTKQTVYFPKDGRNIIFRPIDLPIEKTIRQEGYFFTPEQLNEYTRNVIKQTLETAADKATLLENGKLTYFGRYIIEEGNHYSETEIDVSKESITNTFEEIFKTLER